jgi:dTDP-glucose 4,6-dehydratase
MSEEANNKKILVTGGSGFIGTNLVNELRFRGHKVIACDLLNHELLDYIRCDVRNYRHIQRVFDKFGPFDYVYHLAAEYGRWNGEDHYENLWETNVIGTKHMLRMQEKHKFRMVFFSSAEVYGDYTGQMSEDVMENNPINDTYQMNDYAISKWAGELMCLNSENMFGTETVRVRPVNCYGPHEEYNSYRGFHMKNITHTVVLFQSSFIMHFMICHTLCTRATNVLLIMLKILAGHLQILQIISYLGRFIMLDQDLSGNVI